MKVPRLLKTIPLYLSLGVGPLMAEDSININLHYSIRPPYFEIIDNKLTGLTASPVEAAFKKAKINFTWTQTPLNRQLSILKENTGYDCSAGYFKNSERDKYALFSNPILHSRPFIVIANKDVKHSKITTFHELASNPENVFLMKENYTYGEEIDRQLVILKPNKYMTSSEAPQMLQMIKLRSHYLMMATQEEMDFYIEKTNIIDKKDIQILSLSDFPKGLPRRIMCSKKVGNLIIEKLNRVINPSDVTHNH